MYYYEVYVASQRFHGDDALTYESADELEIGQVVTVQMQRETVVGTVKKKVGKPHFTTKPILTHLDVTVPSQVLALMDWLRHYYPAPLGALLQLCLPSSLGTKGRLKEVEAPAKLAAAELPPLTEEQVAAIAAINRRPTEPVLLHGITGSGKTRVYLELAKAQIEQGQSALILTPEIGLTPQLVERFNQTFPGQVATVHSTLTPAQRRDVWLRIAQTEPLIIIGPRSALFSPIHKLGLVVVDEAHDNAYKQEQAPYYQATRVAATLARTHKAQLILGTATPLIDDYYTFEAKHLPIVKLTHTARSIDEQDITTTVINLREREHFSRSGWLSNSLLDAVNTALNEGEQSLIFLNRRGTARLVLCSSCGWQALCPRCDVPLTYHGDSHHIECHTCGYTDRAPTSCASCGSGEITFKSIGTKSLVAELERHFPKARIGRFDSDSKKDERLETTYARLQNGEVDILVGTQILGKGLDLPKLSVVGVVVADTSLYFPDYTAEERTFQMLTQVFGRVGRGHRSGSIIIQSYNPDNPTIQQAIARDYDGFYATQVKERELYHFPPFYFVLKLRCGRKSQAFAEQASHKLAQDLLQQHLPIELSGPSSAFIEKNNNVYYWQIIIKAKQRKVLLDIIKHLPANWSYDIDPTNLL